MNKLLLGLTLLASMSAFATAASRPKNISKVTVADDLKIKNEFWESNSKHCTVTVNNGKQALGDEINVWSVIIRSKKDSRSNFFGYSYEKFENGFMFDCMIPSTSLVDQDIIDQANKILHGVIIIH